MPCCAATTGAQLLPALPCRGVCGLPRHGRRCRSGSSQISPKGFFPQEDIGQLQVSTMAREDISFDADGQACRRKVADVFAKSPYVAHVGSSVGTGGGGSARDECRAAVRGAEAQGPSGPAIEKVLADLRRQLGRIPGISTYMNPVQNLSARRSRRRPANTSSSCRASTSGPDERVGRRSSPTRWRRTTAYFHRRHHATCRTMRCRRRWSSIATRRRRSASTADMLRSTLYGGFGTRAGLDDLHSATATR